MKDTTTVNNFKDLKDALAEVRKNNPPAETRYEKQAKHMGYTKDKTIVVEELEEKKDSPKEFEKKVVHTMMIMKKSPANKNKSDAVLRKGAIKYLTQKPRGASDDWDEDKKENVQEGTWSVPDSYKKLYSLQIGFLQTPSKANPANAKRMAKNIYNIFGDDGFYDDLLKVEKGDDTETKDLRDLIVKHLEPWGLKFKKGSKYQITHAPQKWVDNMTAEPAESAKKRKSGNLKPTGLGRSMKVDLLKEDEIGRAKEVISLQKKHDREKDLEKDKLEKEKEKAKASADRAKQSESKEDVSEASALADMQDIVKNKGAKKVQGVMVDMFTASVITQAYDKVNDANKKKMEKSNVQTLVKLAQKVMGLKASNEFGKDPLKGFPYNESVIESLKESFVTKSPFKLKSKQYPRALAIETDGYGKRHASVDDIIEACDSFGMITEEELQIQQVEKTLGQKGFLTYNRIELSDIFEDRETQRMILSLESLTGDEGTTEYDRATINRALEEELHVEFVKPDGMKAVGPVLKMSSNTYNLKDMHTGKSFTYKYIEEDKHMKTFGEVISEAKFPKKLVRQAGGIAFDKRYVAGNMTGAINAIEKLKKGLSDDPDVRDMLRLANESFNNEFYKSMSEEDKTEYQKFFQKTLKQFGVQSPAELEGDKEKEFYNYIDKNWKGKGEKKESVEVEEGKYTKYSDLLVKKAKLVAQGPVASKEVAAVNKEIAKEMKKLGVKETQVKVDGRIRPFKEKMTKLGYFKR